MLQDIKKKAEELYTEKLELFDKYSGAEGESVNKNKLIDLKEIYNFNRYYIESSENKFESILELLQDETFIEEILKPNKDPNYLCQMTLTATKIVEQTSFKDRLETQQFINGVLTSYWSEETIAFLSGALSNKKLLGHLKIERVYETLYSLLIF